MRLLSIEYGGHDFDQVGRALGAIGVHFTIRVYDVMADVILHQLGVARWMHRARSDEHQHVVQPISASSAR